MTERKHAPEATDAPPKADAAGSQVGQEVRPAWWVMALDAAPQLVLVALFVQATLQKDWMQACAWAMGHIAISALRLSHKDCGPNARFSGVVQRSGTTSVATDS